MVFPGLGLLDELCFSELVAEFRELLAKLVSCNVDSWLAGRSVSLSVGWFVGCWVGCEFGCGFELGGW